MMRSNCFECCLGVAWVLIGCCLGTASGAAWVLLGCCLGAATAARKSHASHTPCEHFQKRCSHGAHKAWNLRAAATADGRFDCTIVH
eukprot:11163281-Lingulodinium_polyedra.AAC.1